MTEKLTSVAGMSVLITGAAMGMGRIYANKAVAEGAARVVLWDIDEALLNQAKADLSSQSTDVTVQVVDVSSLEAVRAAASEVLAGGPIDVLINNAGIVRGKYFWEHDQERDIAATMSINALAPMHVTREFLPAMMASRSQCRIVTIASAAGLVSDPGMSIYAASKWAAIGFSDSLRLELTRTGHDHVGVTTVCPTFISTGMFAGAKPPVLTRLMTPEYVTDRTWNAMLVGKAQLLLPWTVHLSKVLKGILPLPAWDFLAGNVFGVYSTMKDFTGRK
ncbi:SDR family NAD(P)-dependent oxidoreductase [Homoserinimonas sp. A447]